MERIKGYENFDNDILIERFLGRYCRGKWKINNGVVDLQGTFEMTGFFSADSMEILKSIKFGKVGGKFILRNQSESPLEDIKFSPTYVGSDFDIRGNHILSLKGGPSIVKGLYICDDNLLENLEGAPSEYGNAFICERNPLESLRGFKWNGTSYLTTSQFVLGPDRFECKVRDSEIINSLIEDNPDCIELVAPIFQTKWFQPSPLSLGLYKAWRRGL